MDENDWPTEHVPPIGTKLRSALLATVGAGSILALGAWATMLMWNFAVVAALTVAEPITFWHGLCIMVLLTVRFNLNGSD